MIQCAQFLNFRKTVGRVQGDRDLSVISSRTSNSVEARSLLGQNDNRSEREVGGKIQLKAQYITGNYLINTTEIDINKIKHKMPFIK